MMSIPESDSGSAFDTLAEFDDLMPSNYCTAVALVLYCFIQVSN